MVRAAYEERFVLSTKQRARLDQWEKGDAAKPVAGRMTIPIRRRRKKCLIIIIGQMVDNLLSVKKLLPLLAHPSLLAF